MSPRIALSVITVEGRGASPGSTHPPVTEQRALLGRRAGGRAGGRAGRAGGQSGRAERSVEGQQQQQQARAEQLSDVEPRPDHGRFATGAGGTRSCRSPSVVRNTRRARRRVRFVLFTRRDDCSLLL